MNDFVLSCPLLFAQKEAESILNQVLGQQFARV